MYLYRVADGEYDFYMEEILVHDKQFTKEEFAEMVKESGVKNCRDISDFLCEKYSFKVANFTAGAHFGYEQYKGRKFSFIGEHKSSTL